MSTIPNTSRLCRSILNIPLIEGPLTGRDSRIGSEGGGNTFPGVTRPWGVVKLGKYSRVRLIPILADGEAGPDLYSGTDAYSGYLASGVVTGFSMTHESGTGGAPKYGVVSQMCWVGNISNPLMNLTANRTEPDQANVGYYKTSLDIAVTVELAATSHAGLYRYNFSDRSRPHNVVVDVSHVLSSYRGQGLGQNYSYGGIEVFSDGHYETNGTYDNGWNRSPDWTIYSCGRFSESPSQMAVFEGVGYNTTSYGQKTSSNGTHRLGAFFSFPPNSSTVESRVGISSISSKQACHNLDSEITETTSFHTLVRDTVSMWNSEVLSKITVPASANASSNDLRQLYSMMYGTFIIPSNKTGENPLWDSAEPYYDDTFTLWDLNRCATALWQVLEPTFYEEYIRSLIDIWRNEGYLPDARSSFFNGRTQGGSNADNVLADAYVKGVRGQVKWTDGYGAMVKDAEVTPVNGFDPQANDSSTREGRGALPDWEKYGYITPRFSRAVSRAVEYAVNDFSLHQVARGLNRTADATKYLNRSAQWRNHWNPDQQSLGFSGFIVPRYANGSFEPYDPLQCGGCYWSDPYYEALPWEYSFTAIHDIATLINLCGGPDTFRQRLDKFFEPGINNSTGTAQFDFTLMNPSNEPDFATPYLYHFIGRQDLSVDQSRYIADSFYFTNTTGLPGNSDAGAMETWWLWNAIGLYPITGQTTFLIHSPRFSMNVDLGSDKFLNITTAGGNPNTAFQVQSLKVNGKDWTKNWLTFDDVFANGGTMDFVLGANASDWFAGGELPPSPGAMGMARRHHVEG